MLPVRRSRWTIPCDQPIVGGRSSQMWRRLACWHRSSRSPWLLRSLRTAGPPIWRGLQPSMWAGRARWLYPARGRGQLQRVAPGLAERLESGDWRARLFWILFGWQRGAPTASILLRHGWRSTSCLPCLTDSGRRGHRCSRKQRKNFPVGRF